MTFPHLGTLCSRYLLPLSVILTKYSSKGAHTWFSMGDNKCTCQRLTTVIGDGDKINDVVFCGAVSDVPEGNVVFFGGDVQEYSENMLAHRDNKRYEEWNLESTARLLCQLFPHNHIWVVKASRMTLKTFAVYSNFVTSNDVGCPEHEAGQMSWHHLYKLLGNAGERLRDACSEQTEDTCVDVKVNALAPVTLVGFSKGCVVLNQLLYDLALAKQDKDVGTFTDVVKAMYWLDGGHNGGLNTWIVHESVLKNLVGADIEVHSHVTPYQTEDDRRPWVGKEQKKFVSRLQRLGVAVNNTLHFSEETRSLDMHFRLLKEF